MSEASDDAVEVGKKVYAVATSASASVVGSSVGRGGAKLIQEAMEHAINYCYSNGITDPVLIKEKMMQAREAVKRVLAEKEVTPEGNDEG